MVNWIYLQNELNGRLKMNASNKDFMLQMKQNALAKYSTNREEAMDEMLLVANLHDLEAIKILAEWNLAETGDECYQAAVQLLETAANQFNDADSMVKLAQLESDMDYWQLAYQMNDPRAIRYLAHVSQTDYSEAEPSYPATNLSESALEYSTKAAKLGDTQSLRWLAERTTAEESLSLYILAADSGDFMSFILAANMLVSGQSVEQDIPRAVELYANAARAITRPTFAQLGSFVTDGRSPDYEKAFNLFLEGASKGW
jgi:TPR repeat protein